MWVGSLTVSGIILRIDVSAVCTHEHVNLRYTSGQIDVHTCMHTYAYDRYGYHDLSVYVHACTY